MARSTFERLNLSAPAMGLKALLRKHSPSTAERLRCAVHGARRALLEPPAPRPPDERLFWDPPPRRYRGRLAAAGEVSEALFARLDEEDLAAMLDRLDDADRERWEQAGESARKMLALHFCVHYEVPAVLDVTGLSDAVVPPGVTELGRGSLAAGGSLYYADLVADALRQIGAPLPTHRRALDFGCSSGRVVRVLAAFHRELEWHACDPDEAAIAWASESLPGVGFFVSPVEPPLPFPDGHLDLVYAISIWTHFSEPAALRWFDEMHRLIAPGGHLLLTAHGNRAVERRAGERGEWPRRLVAEIATALYTDGYKFVGGYGGEVSSATATPDWGDAFFTPEWLAHHLCPRWTVAQFEAARVEGHHDLYLLERRP